MAQYSSTQKNQRIFTILKWVFTAIYLISALAVLTDKAFLSFTLLLIGALLIFPLFSEFWKSKIPILQNKIAKVSILILLFIVGFAMNKGLRKNLMNEEDKKQFIAEFIRNDTTTQNIQFIKKLAEIGVYFKDENNCAEYPTSNCISVDSTSSRNLFVFNPKFNFTAQTKYLKEDATKGKLQNISVYYSIDKNNKVSLVKTVLTYSKSGKLEFQNQTLPSYITMLDTQVISAQKQIYDIEQLAIKKTEEHQRKIKQFEENCLSIVDGSHSKLVDWRKETMDNPESFDHVETTYNVFDDYAIILMKYRGKNRFGALILTSLKAKVSLEDCSIISVEQ